MKVQVSATCQNGIGSAFDPSGPLGTGIRYALWWLAEAAEWIIVSQARWGGALLSFDDPYHASGIQVCRIIR